jgi:hypothetical protein
MRKSSIRFGELRDLLLEIGFSANSHEQGRLRFEHPVTGTILLFRIYGSSDVVTQHSTGTDRGAAATGTCGSLFEPANHGFSGYLEPEVVDCESIPSICQYYE